MMTKKITYSSLLGIAVGVVFSFQASAQLTSDHVAKMKMVTNTEISSNGEIIAYTVSNPTDPKKENAASQNHLYVYKVSTNEQLPFFTNGSVSNVKFRPEKGTITFLSRVGNEKINSLYEISIHGGEAKKIFTYSNNIASYEWSNSGNQIAFISAERMNKPKTSLPYSPTFFEEEYATRNAYVVNLSSGGKEQKLNLLDGSAYMMKWSPDDTKIAISVAPTASVDDSYMAQKVKVVNVQGKNIIAHVENKGKLTQFEWSPSGKELVLLGAFDLNDPTGGTISIVNASGGQPRVVDGDFLGKYEKLLWKEEDKIHFLASESTSSVIGTLSLNDEKFKDFIVDTEVRHITTFSLSNEGDISFVANAPQHPSELFYLSTRDNIPTKITNSNPWLSKLNLGKQEVVKYTARDGKYEIHGMVIYPLNYQEGKKYPLITVVHGGPEAHYSNGWLTNYSMPGQMGAAEGYVVFYPNYRGSTGRGVDFTYSSQADLAGAEFDDIVDGVDYLIDEGIVDPKRVGVTGGSYGGYASAWMSTYYSDRFAAAVMFVGISNNISKFGTSDIPTEMELVHERGNIWDNWQKQLEVSPIYYVDRSQTPILIMHGAEDPRVHPAQSMELYRHLKVRKPELPVRLIYYPGEGHGNARSSSRYDYNQRMMQWFDVYLKSGNPRAKIPSLDLPE